MPREEKKGPFEQIVSLVTLSSRCPRETWRINVKLSSYHKKEERDWHFIHSKNQSLESNSGPLDPDHKQVTVTNSDAVEVQSQFLFPSRGLVALI